MIKLLITTKKVREIKLKQIITVMRIKIYFFFGVSSQWSITENEGPGFLVGLTRLALKIIQSGRYFEKTVISNE